eukprot:scaffold15396_cov140-Isochrysis_galbana.AAC.3
MGEAGSWANRREARAQHTTIHLLGYADRRGPCLRRAVARRGRGIHEHLFAWPHVCWADQPDKLTTKVGLEAAIGVDPVGNGNRVLLHAARPRRNLHVQS